MDIEEFVRDVQLLGALQDHDRAVHVTEAIVGTLCGRISSGEAEQLANELPNVVRKICTIPRPEEAQFAGDLPEFIDRIGAETDLHPQEARRMTQAVFHVLKENISENEVQDVAAQLPGELKVTWLEA